MRFEEPPQFSPDKQEGKSGKVRRVDMNNPRTKEYWERCTPNLSLQINIKNIVALNRSSVYLYETEGEEQESRLNHVIWIHNNREDILTSTYRAIDMQEWKNLSQKQEVIEGVNNILIESYNSVLDFYNWNYQPKGFVIEGSEGFGMGAGKGAGIRIIYRKITPLIKAVEVGDIEEVKRQQKHIAASIVHELTHLEKDETMSRVMTEIASHVIQFIFNPKDNEIFNDQLEFSLIRIAENRKPDGQKPKEQKPLNLYDKAQYIALLITTYELSNHSKVYHDILLNDQDPNKLEALKNFQRS